MAADLPRSLQFRGWDYGSLDQSCLSNSRVQKAEGYTLILEKMAYSIGPESPDLG